MGKLIIAYFMVFIDINTFYNYIVILRNCLLVCFIFVERGQKHNKSVTIDCE